MFRQHKRIYSQSLQAENTEVLGTQALLSLKDSDSPSRAAAGNISEVQILDNVMVNKLSPREQRPPLVRKKVSSKHRSVRTSADLSFRMPKKSDDQFKRLNKIRQLVDDGLAKQEVPLKLSETTKVDRKRKFPAAKDHAQT